MCDTEKPNLDLDGSDEGNFWCKRVSMMVPFPTPLGPQITIGRGRGRFVFSLFSDEDDDVWRCSLLDEADADRSRVAPALSLWIPRVCNPKLLHVFDS